MNRKYRSWIPGIVVWAWFLGSLAFAKRYPWLDTFWNAVWIFLLLVIAVASTIQIFRDRDKTSGIISYRGVPRWVVTLFGGDEEMQKPSAESKDIRE